MFFYLSDEGSFDVEVRKARYIFEVPITRQVQIVSLVKIVEFLAVFCLNVVWNFDSKINEI